LLKYLSRWT